MALSLRPCIAALCLLAMPVAAEGRGKIAFRDADCSMTVAKGDLVSRGKTLVVEGDQATRTAVALDGDVVVRAGARVKAVMAIRGSVTVEAGAHVEGNVAALKGDVHVAEGAILEGRASALSGRVHAAPGAKILGETPELFTRVHEEDVLRALWGHILSEKDPGYCEPRIIGD